MYGITHESQLTLSFQPFFHLVHNVIVNLKRSTFKRIHKTILCSFSSKVQLVCTSKNNSLTVFGVPVCTESFKCMKPFWVLFKIFISYQVRNICKKHQIEFFKKSQRKCSYTKREKPYLSLDLKIRRVLQMPF